MQLSNSTTRIKKKTHTNITHLQSDEHFKILGNFELVRDLCLYKQISSNISSLTNLTSRTSSNFFESNLTKNKK